MMDYYQIDNFLEPQQNLDLLRSAIELESCFTPTTTSTGAENYRQSTVLYSLPPATGQVLERISQVLPVVIEKLGILRFDITQTECQMTSHNDGHYYKIHNDNGSSDTYDRVLSYVYYFYNCPKAFEDGELKIHGNPDSIVEPRNNSIVFFQSSLMHEVLPISCPSRVFKDGRFTVNGWLRN